MRRLVWSKAIAAPVMLLAALSLGCVAGGGFYSAAPVYGVGYYGPFGFDYGVWGPSYRVAPFRAPVRGGVVLHAGTAPHFRPARFGRPVPSIPRRRRARRALRHPVLTVPPGDNSAPAKVRVLNLFMPDGPVMALDLHDADLAGLNAASH